MRMSRALLGLCCVVVVLAGCGGDDGGTEDAGERSTTTTADGGDTTTTAGEAPDDELPAFLSDFDRVCESQVGFGGASEYDGEPGVHPIALFADYDDPPSLLQSSVTLPAGWAVAEDADFEDNSELAATELVGCAIRTDARPNGTPCEFEGDDGDEPITLELVDTTYELTIYRATTGEAVGEPQTLEAVSTDCPFVASIGEGDTQYFNDPTEEQYVDALKETVNP